MTIALGFNCPDGIVLCTDSLESDGVTKTLVNKIWCYQTQEQWGIAVASAGEADFSESFTDNLRELFMGETYDKDHVMLSLRQAINAARNTYPDLNWAALFALFGPGVERNLLRLSPGSKHFAPVQRYEALGVGSQLAKFMCAQMYTLFMNVEEAAELGVFTIMRCNEYVDGCGGPISVLTYTVGQKSWGPIHPDRVREIEGRYPREKLRGSLLDFWVGQTKHINRTMPFYRRLSHGGFVKLINATATRVPPKPQRSTSRKSKRGK